MLEHSRIVDLPVRIADSLIGRNVEIGRSPYKPKAYKLTLGDHSKVGHPVGGCLAHFACLALAAGILHSDQALVCPLGWRPL